MREITFAGYNLNEEIDKLYTVDVDKPLVAPKSSNKAEIPGKDFAYNFGNNYKQDFDITVDFVLVPGEETSLGDEEEALADILDTEGAESLEISGSEREYEAQVVDGIIPERDQYGQISRITVIFECRESENSG